MVGAVPREGERIVQTRIGPSLIKRGSRFAWLALIDSAKILTITGARSWLFPTKSYRVKRLLLHFTFYRADAVLYRSTYLFLYQLSTLPCFFWPQGLLHIIAKMYVQDVTHMSQKLPRHNMPDMADQTVFLLQQKYKSRDICLNN